MPLGLKNVTQTFQRFIDAVFRDLDFIFVYVDDIIIMSETPQQHCKHFRQVFQRLAAYSLSINTSKCILDKTEVKFLGYTIN